MSSGYTNKILVAFLITLQHNDDRNCKLCLSSNYTYTWFWNAAHKWYRNLKNVAYLFDLFCVYEANVVTEIPKTAND